MTQININLNETSLEEWDRIRSMIDSYFGILNVTGAAILADAITIDKVKEEDTDGFSDLVGEPVIPSPPTHAVIEKVVPAREAIENHTNTDNIVELDTDDCPWDARIHSKGRTKNADGRWKRKKMISDELYETVRKELLSVPAAPTSPEPSTIPKPPSTSTQEPVVDGSSQDGTSASGAVAFPDILLKVKEGIQAGTVQPAAISDWLDTKGVEGGIPMLSNRPELYNEFMEAFSL
jgi:hypothetical protein